MARQCTGAWAILAVAFLLLTSTSCSGLVSVPVGQVQEETRTVDLGDAQAARIQVTMGAGNLRLTGGAGHLMVARFTYNVAEWRPKVDYAVRDGTGELNVKQPSSQGTLPLGSVRYEWDLRLSDDVPMEVHVALGAGTAQLTLGGLRLRRLDLEVGAGEVALDLTGEWSQDLAATIKGGVGHLTVVLPRDVGARVEATGGLGHINAAGLRYDGSAYVNDAYGQSAVTLRLAIEAGVGAIDLQAR